MAARRLAQESLDSVLQEKSKRYGDSEAVGEALHLKAQGKLRCLACAGGALWTVMLWVQAELLGSLLDLSRRDHIFLWPTCQLCGRYCCH